MCLSPPFGHHQIILLGDWGICVWATVITQKWKSGVEPVSSWCHGRLSIWDLQRCEIGYWTNGLFVRQPSGQWCLLHSIHGRFMLYVCQSLKVGFHYPSSRPVNSGSGNRPLFKVLLVQQQLLTWSRLFISMLMSFTSSSCLRSDATRSCLSWPSFSISRMATSASCFIPICNSSSFSMSWQPQYSQLLVSSQTRLRNIVRNNAADKESVLRESTNYAKSWKNLRILDQEEN